MDERQDNKAPLIPETTLRELQGQATKPYCVAVIPCKCGSTRLPDKNFLEVLGFPMVVWSVMKAICCPHINQVVISTDNTELFLEKAPNLQAKMFDDVACLQRGTAFMHPDTPIYSLIGEALQGLAANEHLERPPTHVVMLQPNVPSLPQILVNDLVKAVVEGPYNVARHYSVALECFDKEWVSGKMTGGCDAYKIAALVDPTHMDSYNYSIISADLEIHTEEDLKMVEDLLEQRMKDKEEE